MSRQLITTEEVFDLIVKAAIAGERCPIGYNYHTGALVNDGRIRIEISGRNWRTVEILTGEHKGKRTKNDPSGSMPHKIIQKAAAA